MEEIYFDQLRNVCVDLTKNPTINSARAFSNILKQLPTEIFDKFLQYILFTVRLTLKKCRSMDEEIDEETKVAIVENLNIFIEKCEFTNNSSTLAPNLLSDLVVLINIPGTDNLTGSDQLLVATVSCITKLCQKCKTNGTVVCQLLCSNEFRPFLAHCVTCVLKILRRMREKSVLNCLNDLVCLSTSIAASFLPGVSAVLIDLLLNSQQLNEEDFLSLCFKTLSQVIITASDDEENQTKDWHENAGLQLKSLVERLSAIFICHTSTKLRMCLAEFAVSLYHSNADVLKDSKKRLLEILAILLMDEIISLQVLDMFVKDKVFELLEQFPETIYSSLTSICWRLPRMSKPCVFDIQQRIEWQHLCGSLKLLGNNRNNGYFFLNDSQLKLFCRSLCESIEINNVVWEFDAQSNLLGEESFHDNSKLSIRQPSDLYAQKLLTVDCFDILSDNKELDVILDCFYNIFQTNNSDLKIQASFILNGILQRVSQKNNNLCSLDLVENLLEDYLQWIDTNEVSSVNIHLALNGIIIAASLIKENIQSYLIRALYWILVLYDSPISKQKALSALQNLAKVFNLPSAKMLLINNLDYFTSSIITKLKQLTLNPEAPQVLSALLEVLGVYSLYNLRHAVIECLATVDRCKENNPSLPVLLNCLEKFGSLCKGIEIVHSNETPLLQEYNEEESQDEDYCNSKTKSNKLPWQICLAIDNLNSIHCWLGAESFTVRMASVEALRENLCALKSTKDELLPAIHRCWPSVLARLKDAETSSKAAAFRVILSMAEISGDFVRHRVENEAYPLLEKFVLSNVGDVRRAGVAYQQCSAFRLQLEICKNLAELCVKINCSEEFRTKCLTLLNLYVNEHQAPKSLQEIAKISIDMLNGMKLL